MNLLHFACLYLLALAPGLAAAATPATPIDRQAVVARHDPQLRAIDPQAPLTVGNGRFAFTADVTGLQTLPDLYQAPGIALETQARWSIRVMSVLVMARASLPVSTRPMRGSGCVCGFSRSHWPAGDLALVG